ADSAAVLDPGMGATLVVRAGALGEGCSSLSGRGDRELLPCARSRCGQEQEGGAGEQGSESAAHGMASGSSRGIRALAMYCWRGAGTSDLPLTRPRTQTVPSATLIRVEPSQRSTTSQVVPCTVAEP